MSDSFHILRKHFFRRFFDNDTLSIEGDTTTTVVRALSFVATPGLMVAFFLQPEYSDPRGREKWAMVGDHYFFVLIAMVTMGLAAVFAWEMLFADRLDFLVLTPLPLRQRTILFAKSTALAQYLGWFLLSVNLFGALMLPAIPRPSPTLLQWLHHLSAHADAGIAGGSFMALLVLAVGGMMVCVLDAETFRRISSLVQMVLVLGMTLLLFLFPLVAHFMQAIVERPDWTRWLPPFWFLGVYEMLFHGLDAPAWAAPLAREAMWSLGIVAVISVVTYPLAWARKRRMAIENTAGGGVRRLGPLSLLLFRVGARATEERAVFAFISQALARNQRYQIYMSIYAGAGLALAASCTLLFRAVGGTLGIGLSRTGLHAVMPILLFWLMSGLRTAFSSPVTLDAAWVFGVSGVSMERCVAAARRWVLLCGLLATAMITLALRCAGWTPWQLTVQAVCGASLATVLADLFFAFRQGVPFTRPRMPGKSSLPMLMAMYLMAFPVVVTTLADFTPTVEQHRSRLWILPAIALGVHLWWRERLRRETYWDEEEEMEGTLTLGLTAQ